VVERIAVTFPERVNRVILLAAIAESDCDGETSQV
jgi:hypothetical protein